MTAPARARVDQFIYGAALVAAGLNGAAYLGWLGVDLSTRFFNTGSLWLGIDYRSFLMISPWLHDAVFYASVTASVSIVGLLLFRRRLAVPAAILALLIGAIDWAYSSLNASLIDSLANSLTYLHALFLTSTVALVFYMWLRGMLR